MTKTCFKCKKDLPLTSEFFHVNSRNKDGFYGTCKECRNTYRSEWREEYKEKHGERADKKYEQENKEKFAKWSAKRVKENADWVDKLKEETPCADCHNNFPAVCMDFDHIKDKKFKGVCYLVQQGYSQEKIQAEIDKCEIVCANCHRIRTHASGRERPWYDRNRKYDRSDW
jgi:hypothetical protein